MQVLENYGVTDHVLTHPVNTISDLTQTTPRFEKSHRSLTFVTLATFLSPSTHTHVQMWVGRWCLFCTRETTQVEVYIHVKAIVPQSLKRQMKINCFYSILSSSLSLSLHTHIYTNVSRQMVLILTNRGWSDTYVYIHSYCVTVT